VIVPVLVVVIVALLAAAGWWAYHRSGAAGQASDSLPELVRQAEALPPSPTRTVIRLRVELRESTDAADAATEAARGTTTDLSDTMRRLREVADGLDRDLAVLSGKSDAAIGPVVPALRTRVRETQAVADRVVVLARDIIAGGAQQELTRIHDELDHELRVIDAHRELGEG
jgi:hypothetical protein